MLIENDLNKKNLIENMNQKGQSRRQSIGFVLLFIALLLYQKVSIPNQQLLQLISVIFAVVGLYLVFVDD